MASDFTALVTIESGDAGFTTSAACQWTQDLSPITASPTADFTAGSYQVGVDVASGTWRTRSNSTGCRWTRLSGFSSEFSDVIGSDLRNVTTIVTIGAGDVGFTTNDKCLWTRDLSPITASPTADFGGGTYQVGIDVDAGEWTSTGGAGCSWERLSGFSGSFTEIIASDFTNVAAVVNVAAGDAGFYASSACGTWTKTG